MLSVPYSILAKYTHCARKPHKSVACVVRNNLMIYWTVLGPQETDWPSQVLHCSLEVGKLLAIFVILWLLNQKLTMMWQVRT